MHEIFIRIGTDYYKKVKVPISENETVNRIIPWKRQPIIDDYGRDYLREIKSYEGFVTIPSHDKFQLVLNGFYNQYEPLGHQLAIGEFPVTKMFLEHIFGEQYDLGLDYLSILWQHPRHILPILSLVSSERNTGKTTFLNWLKLIFKGNMTINKNEDFRSKFNSDWAGKLIIAIDEVLLDRIEDSERIKNLSTAQFYKSESKGKDKVEIPFFGKFILCSNNEENFIKVESSEIRYWVRKVNEIKNYNPQLMSQLEKELPFFINHIKTREITSPKKHRMWFTPEQIKTDALTNLIRGNKTNLEKELLEILFEKLEFHQLDEISYTIGDLRDLLRIHGIITQNNKISHLLRTNWKLQSRNSSYDRYVLVNTNSNLGPFGNYEKSSGRVFSFSREFLLMI